MSTTQYVQPSWEVPRSDDVHSPRGIAEIRAEAKAAMLRRYAGLAEGMYRWTFPDTWSDMLVMSQGEAPEKYLYLNGSACTLDLDGQRHVLPYTAEGGLNLYGKIVAWHPQPVSDGYMRRYTPGSDPLFDRLTQMRLDEDTSVIIRNDLLAGSDVRYIDRMCDILVDNLLSTNQQQLLARSPFVFSVSEDNLVSAKNFLKSICDCKPAIFTNAQGERIDPVTVTPGKIDSALFEIWDRVECMILDQLGYPAVPITKRAQQSVSEVESNSDKLYARRQEKLRQREMACDRIFDIYGDRVTVVSVVDEMRGDSVNASSGGALRMEDSMYDSDQNSSEEVTADDEARDQ